MAWPLPLTHPEIPAIPDLPTNLDLPGPLTSTATDEGDE